MQSLSNIPEPTTAYRPDHDEPTAPVAPLSIALPNVQTANDKPDKRTAADHDQPQQQIDSVLCLILLLIAGALLRFVLGFFGPVQGVDEAQVQQILSQGQATLSGEATSAYPLFELLWSAVAATSAPDWAMSVIGSLLTLAAVPAAYIIGQATTGRRAAGILAAAILAVHPAVLTASIMPTGTAIALGLLTIGLALACLAATRGVKFVLGGGLLLALAGLAAPMGWLVGVLAAPLVARLCIERGPARALGYAAVVFVLALTPAMAYRAAFLGHTSAALLPEFVQTTPNATPLSPTQRLLVTMTDPSLSELGDALHLPLADAGRLSMDPTSPGVADFKRDPVADFLADAWLLMNAAVAGLAVVSVGVMWLRRRFIETLTLAGPMVAIAFCVLPPAEMLRLPMLALIGALAVGMFATRSAVELDEQALADKAARKAAKAAARQEKQHLKEERQLNKNKDRLYAFDQPARRAKKDRKKSDVQPAEPPAALGILTERIADESPTSTRPI